ncbi:MAG TPA: response regulator [Polyangiaceae bacterium]|nr:response regulator [Polyangiaceae bacterium]
MNKPLKVLLVEDNENDAMLSLMELRRAGYTVEHARVDTRADMIAALESGHWDLILSDFSMPEFSAPEAFRVAREHGTDTPFIIVSGTVGEDVAVDAMRAGVNDYVLKGALARLAPAVERELREAAQRAERRKMEERLALADRMLQQSQKMEAVGRLAAGVAHDFNNILSVILSYSDMLLADQVPVERMKEDIDEIHQAALRAADLTRQLLTFSRQQVVAPRVLNLNDTVVSLDRMLRRLLGERIELKSVMATDLGMVKADPSQIEQVVMNLVVNARDAMPNGGVVTIETANVELDETYAASHPHAKTGPHVMLSLTDTGTGMSYETQMKVFEPFFTTKEKGKGTGLGLAMVFGIVRQSGGTIWLHSELGQGTTFKIFLPRSDDAVSEAKVTVTTTRAQAVETLLVVEDDPSVRQVVISILRRLGYRVLAAESSRHAMELCRAPEEIHLVISDVMMPEKNGPELVAELKQIRPAMKTLFISGYTDAAVVPSGTLENEVHFLQKPLTPEALAEKVGRILRS